MKLQTIGDLTGLESADLPESGIIIEATREELKAMPSGLIYAEVAVVAPGEIAALTSERDQLRSIMVKIAASVGATVSQDSTLEFLADLPKEVELHAGKISDERDAALAKGAELQAVVDRLPKTADGVHIVAGMTIYRLGDDEIEPYCVDKNIFAAYHASGLFDCVMCGGGHVDYYSTRDAALAAQAKADAGKAIQERDTDNPY